MKSFLKTLVFISSVVSVSAFAALDEAGPVRGQCLIKLSAEQQNAVKKLHAEAAPKLKELKAEVAKARAALAKAISDAQTTKEEAQALGAALKEKRDAQSAIQAGLKLDASFDVLTAEQRVKQAKCEGRRQKPQHGRVERAPQRHGPGRRHDGRIGRPLPQHRAPVPHHHPSRRGGHPHRSHGRGPRPLV